MTKHLLAFTFSCLLGAASLSAQIADGEEIDSKRMILTD